jgi:hypothetical protein
LPATCSALRARSRQISARRCLHRERGRIVVVTLAVDSLLGYDELTAPFPRLHAEGS